jgi:glycosyltransferase involved in cell wall biosynthesis
VICSNYAWTIFNFRMSLIRRLNDSGYNVVVITQFDGYEKKITSEGSVLKVYPLRVSRKGINPFVDLITFFDLFKKLRHIKPDYFLPFTIKPVIYGSIAARFNNILSMPTITGLGTVFISKNWVTRLVRILYRFALKKTSIVFFQNNDDKTLFINEGIVNPKICKLTPGSGIELDKFQLSNIPKNSISTFLFIGRILKDKGIYELIEAARYIKKLYPSTNFQILGPLDVENRTVISKSQINQWVKESIIEYLGKTDNVSNYIKASSCVILPSYREGTSRVLLEAAAIGRPIIATDVPGCREIVEDGSNGFLCKSKDSVDLGNKIQKMILLPYEDKIKMGLKGRRKIEAQFDQKIVCDLYLRVIKSLSN